MEPVEVIVALVDSLATLLVEGDCDCNCDEREEDDTLAHELPVNVIRVEREDI